MTMISISLEIEEYLKKTIRENIKKYLLDSCGCPHSVG